MCVCDCSDPKMIAPAPSPICTKFTSCESSSAARTGSKNTDPVSDPTTATGRPSLHRAQACSEQRGIDKTRASLTELRNWSAISQKVGNRGDVAGNRFRWCNSMSNEIGEIVRTQPCFELKPREQHAPQDLDFHHLDVSLLHGARNCARGVADECSTDARPQALARTTFTSNWAAIRSSSSRVAIG